MCNGNGPVCLALLAYAVSAIFHGLLGRVVIPGLRFIPGFLRLGLGRQDFEKRCRIEKPAVINMRSVALVINGLNPLGELVQAIGEVQRFAETSLALILA